MGELFFILHISSFLPGQPVTQEKNSRETDINWREGKGKCSIGNISDTLLLDQEKFLVKINFRTFSNIIYKIRIKDIKYFHVKSCVLGG